MGSVTTNSRQQGRAVAYRVTIAGPDAHKNRSPVRWFMRVEVMPGTRSRRFFTGFEFLPRASEKHPRQVSRQLRPPHAFPVPKTRARRASFPARAILLGHLKDAGDPARTVALTKWYELPSLAASNHRPDKGPFTFNQRYAAINFIRLRRPNGGFFMSLTVW